MELGGRRGPGHALLRPHHPHRLARLYLAGHQHADGCTLLQWRGEYHRWAAGAWLPVGDADLDAELARHCRGVFEADYPATPVLDRWLARLFK